MNGYRSAIGYLWALNLNLEYLSTYNESHVILNTIFRMVKLIANTEAKFLITIDPIALGNQFITTIKNKSEIVLLPSNPIKEVLN